MIADPAVPSGIDHLVPSPARIYDYMLGGTFNFQADRDAADRAMAQVPELRDIIMANRGFHGRSARWMAECGLAQFIDIGSGLPTVGNTHEVVRAVNPAAKVVYVDIDPMVAACASELMFSPADTRVLVADVRDPDALLGDKELTEVIDLSEPVGVLITGVLHFVADSSDPWALMRRYVSEVAPGSYFALSHATHDNLPPRSVEAGREEYANASEQFYFRSKAQIAQFFEGLEITPPYEGAASTLSFLGQWHAEDLTLADSDGSRWGFCGVGRKP